LPFSFGVSWCSLALSVSLTGPVFSQPRSASSALNAYQASDDSAIRAIPGKYFSLYAAKDIDGLLSLWTQRSPDYASLKQDLQRQFTAEDRSFGVPTISRVKVEAGKVNLRATVKAVITDLKSNQRREQQMVRNFVFVTEDGQWKVWRDIPAEDDLAHAVVEANTDAERSSLLAEERELVTAELVRELNDQGSHFLTQGDYPRALAIYQFSRGTAEKIGDKVGVARALGNIGNIHRLQGNYAEALEYQQKSLVMSEGIGDQIGIANTTMGIGTVYAQQANFPLALEYFQKGLAMREALGDKMGVARALNSIGNVNDSQGNYVEALEHYQKSLAMSEDLGDKTGMVNLLNNLGLVHYHLGDFVQASESLRKGLAMSESIGYKDGIGSTLIGLGNLFFLQGNYVQALASLQKSLEIFQDLGDKDGLLRALGNTGNVHLAQGNDAQALEYYQKVKRMCEDLDDKDGIATSLENIGVVYDLQGNYVQALNSLQKSLTLQEAVGDKEGIASVLKEIGDVYYEQGNYAQSLDYLQRSLSMRETIKNEAGIAAALASIASVHEKQGYPAEALDFAERAAALARRVGGTETLRSVRITAGTAYRRLNQPVQARLAFEEAISLSEALRTQVAGGEQEQQRFFESKVSPYHAMVDLLIAQDKRAEALTFAERAKARVLLATLQTGRVNITKAMTSQEQQQERGLNGQLVSLNAQIYREAIGPQAERAHLTELKAQLKKARLDFEALQSNIYAAHPELRVHRGETRALNLEEAKDLLRDAQGVLLEYVVTEEVTYLFAVTEKQNQPEVEVHVFALPVKQTDLAKQVEAFRQQLAGRDLDFRVSAHKLYDLLLKPAESLLRGKSSLVIVPDDKLWELPFQALLAEDDRYLIESSAVSYAPSLTVLREMKAQRNRRQAEAAATSGLLALGNPAIGQETIQHARLVLRDEKLEPLPEAEQEVRALGLLYGTQHSKVYVGREAREDRVKTKAGQAGILHFATHGTLNNASPMYSHLVLAQGDTNEDGLLEAWELMQLDLKADLAVLSACETARGRFGAGEGMIGLTWALFVAGVPTTVVSQWQVESASTRDLMLHFHRALQARASATPASQTKAEALRQAALKLMKNPETSHPFYWAGFVLVGDGG